MTMAAARTWNTRHAISHVRTMATPTRSGAATVMPASDCESGRIPALSTSGRGLRQRRLGEPRRELPAIRRETWGIAEALVARLRLLDRHDLEDAAGTGRYHDHAGREEHRLVDGMGDEKRGELALPPQADEIGIEPIAGDLVERSERLVHQQQIWLRDQAARDRHPHAHASRQLARVVPLEALQADAGKRVRNPRPAFLLARLGEIERQADIGLDASPRHQGRILKNESDAASLGPEPVVAPAPPQNSPIAGLQQIRDELEQRALAAAGRSDQRDELPGGDREID